MVETVNNTDKRKGTATTFVCVCYGPFKSQPIWREGIAKGREENKKRKVAFVWEE